MARVPVENCGRALCDGRRAVLAVGHKRHMANCHNTRKMLAACACHLRRRAQLFFEFVADGFALEAIRQVRAQLATQKYDFLIFPSHSRDTTANDTRL